METFQKVGSFIMTITTISAGLYSRKEEIVKGCINILDRIGSEFKDNKDLQEGLIKWFNDKDCGLTMSINAMKKH
jgi:hypothetical protein